MDVNRLIQLLPVILCLAGCGQAGPAADLDEYLTRLERVLEQGSHQIIEASYPSFPAVRALRLEPEEASFDIIEYLRIGRCELQQVVAERNSNLGRLAQPSQRLVHEINFLRLGDACLVAIADDYPELAEALADVIELKRAQLPKVIWQATLGGEEFRMYWQAGSGPLPVEFDEDAALLLALQQLADDIARWRSGDYTIDGERLERQLDLVRRGNGGQQLRAWSELRNTLNAASGVVRDRIQRRPLCFEGMQTPKATILDTVIREWFVGRVQAWAAGLNTRYYEEWPALRSVEQALADVQPPAYVEWREARESFMEDARGSLVEHVEALRPLLEQCSILPGMDSAADGRIALR